MFDIDKNANMKTAKLYSILIITAFSAMFASCQKRGCCGHHHGDCKNHPTSQPSNTPPAK